MAVDACIMQKGFFHRKKFTMDDLVHMSHLSFGSFDANFRLIPGQISNHTILFDKTFLQRGIEIYIENHEICLRLNFPTSMDEIQLFYYLIKLYCKFMEQEEFVKDDEIIGLDEINLQMAYDKRTSADALRELKDTIVDDTYFTIYGILHPISIGKKELDYFETDLDLFGQYLNSKQQMDAYYAAPRIYDIHGIKTGIYSIGTDLPTILPVDLDTNEIKNWYVLLQESKCVRYKDFLNHIDLSSYYDANHCLITITKDKMQNILELCTEVPL